MAWVVGIGIGLFLLFRFPRQMGIAILVAVVLAGVGIGLIAYNSAQNQAAFEKEQAEQALVTALARTDAACGDVRYPVLISFHNGSTKTVTDLWFSLYGTLKGHSKPTTSDYLESDVIIDPGQTYTNCWRPETIPTPNANYWTLDWEARISSVTFR